MDILENDPKKSKDTCLDGTLLRQTASINYESSSIYYLITTYPDRVTELQNLIAHFKFEMIRSIMFC